MGNFARIPALVDHFGKELLDDSDPRLIAAAMCVAMGREDEEEVAAALRLTASWGDRQKLRRMLASCFVTPRSCHGALCEAASNGYEEILRELLRAKASAASEDAGRKTVLHFACEKGHE